MRSIEREGSEDTYWRRRRMEGGLPGKGRKNEPGSEWKRKGCEGEFRRERKHGKGIIGKGGKMESVERGRVRRWTG